MINIFIDTNILLDVIMHRNKFYEHSLIIWNDCEKKRVQGFISAISLNNIHYIMRKRVDSAVALNYVRLILNLFSVIPLDVSILRLAVDFPQKDFEDAIQTFSAIQAKANYIVTRDKEHFTDKYIAIISPEEYLDLFGSN